jgi:haloalkane dehalogenase
MTEISAAFPFESKYAEVLGSRMHYVENGSGDPILLLHGNPTSSYLWRNVIPHLSGLGRCVAPDLIGMGKSDKPDIGYRFVDHARYLDGFIEALGLTNITFVIHDWGGALGFYWARRNPDKVKGIAFMETITRPLTWDEWPEAAKRAFQGFRTPDVGEDLILKRNMFVEQVLPSAVMRKMSDEEMAYYRAPYETRESRLPTLQWPREIPIEGEPADVHEIVAENAKWMCESDVPKLLCWAEPGAIMAAVVRWCEENVRNLKSVNVGGGIHFIPEDQPDAIGEAVGEWMKETEQA